MSYPKKRQGRRAITVDGQHYRWKLWPSSPNSRLVVTGSKNGGQRLEIILLGWQDPWLAISGIQVDDAGMTLFTDAANSPAVIASGFVRETIEFGLSHGWNPEVAAPPLNVECSASKSALSGAPDPSPKKRPALDESERIPRTVEHNLASEKESRILTRTIRIYPAKD
jgi:hypothetical protein